MAGYSQKKLVDKLGLKPGMVTCFLHAPESYFHEVGISDSQSSRGCDFIHAFYIQRSDLERDFLELKNNLKPSGMLWISWPKKAAKVATDLDENVIREIGLQKGLVDVKVCAVDEKWSGLKFVLRLKDRK